MKALLREVDLHVLCMLILFSVGLPFLPFQPGPLIILAVIPQGRIFVRALLDYPRFKQPAAPYLIANEAVVAVAVASHLMFWGVMN